MIKKIMISLFLASAIFANSTEMKPVHKGLVQGCAFGILATTPTDMLSISDVRDKCITCITNSPIQKTNKEANVLVDECLIQLSKNK